MARTRNPAAYSRFVGYLKIALPLIAIGLLSTVFLVQKEDPIKSGAIFSEIDRDTIRDGLSVHNPKYSGVNVNGDRFYLEASRATPDGADPDEVAMVDILGRTDYREGRTISLRAARGTAFLPDQTILLEGGVHIKTSDGYEGLTNAGTAGLDRGSFVSDGPVTLTGPTGMLEAGSMRIETHQSDQGENQVFTFENGVKLKFEPK